ncbi:MAG TPA: SDR family NAD(P)-dependent oxidoreductase [Mycobacteriales bacterium]|nr:SDR family NAD(P)-dependent oxidoreductase [Mycobacteriales bacterium]
MGRLDGRRALVTGGGRGIGAAIARQLAADGATVTVAARTREEIEAVAADIGGAAVVMDVADASSVADAMPRIGDVDVVVANAGVVWPLQRFADTDVAEWEQDVVINLFGAVRVVRAALPGMLDRGWGRIVTISSGAASPPGMPSANAYSTSKAALDMFTLHLAKEVEGTGVTVNAVRPGVVDTEMQTFMRSMPRDQVGEQFHDRFHGLHQRGELLDPADSARFLVDVMMSGDNGTVRDIRENR